MHRHPKHKLANGFTLVELLIVAVVLAIFAAIVIPQTTFVIAFSAR